MTDGIGSGGVACQLECLAAASAEIDLAAIAASAWIGHPACSAEALEDPRRARGPAGSPWPSCSRRTCCLASCHHPSRRRRYARNPGQFTNRKRHRFVLAPEIHSEHD